MGSEQRPICPENDALVEYMRQWWTQMAEQSPKTYTQNTEKNIRTAFTNICKHKFPITNLKEFKEVKGVGKWFVSQMREFFNSNCGASKDDDLANGGKKARGSKNYLPQKNSVAYALLITLHRGTTNGTEYMHKQELIDAAEASGLSRVPITSEKGKGKPGQLSSPREWYSGWSAMGKLIDKGLVCKTSCPARYMLSEAGRRVALECLSRSGMLDSAQIVVNREEYSDSDEQDAEALEFVSSDSPTSSGLNTKKGMRDDVPVEFLERFTIQGYTKEQVLHAIAEVSIGSPPQEISTLWPAVLCRLRETEVYVFDSNPEQILRRNSGDASRSYRNVEGQQNLTSSRNQQGCISLRSTAPHVTHVASVIPCSSLDDHVKETTHFHSQAIENAPRLPPLEELQKFEDAYKVVLILDDREQFTRTKSRNLIEKICARFKIQIEVKRLPVGDGVWIAQHKRDGTKYVLDFIVERKNVDDLRASILDNRYRDQKLRLQRTGIKKILYVVEGDPNTCEAADSIKTACFTTEILEGFDVHRTSSLGDTLCHYGHLTLAIANYYKTYTLVEECKAAGACPNFDDFLAKCQDFDKLTVSDVFATQLMQVPQVTEEVVIAVLDCYPTLYSLALAYANLDENTVAQEELLMKKCKGVVNAVASKNIFQFVWA